MKNFFLASFFALSLSLVFGAAFANAQSSVRDSNPALDVRDNNPLGVRFKLDNPFKVGDDLFELVENIVNKIIMPIGGVLCVLAFIYAGFMYVTARGDTAQIKTAHTALLYAAIGTAILLGAWVIASVIRNTINQVIS